MGVGSGCYTCSSVIIVIISIVVLILGLAISGVGGVLLWGTAIFDTYVSPILKDLLSGFSVSNFTISADDLLKQILSFLSPMSVGVFIAGVILVVVGFCGVFGPCCKSKCLLITFAAVSAAILIAEFGIIIWVGTSEKKFVTMTGDYIQTSINNAFVGIKATNFQTLMINLLQGMLGCCGVTNGTDFSTATKWDRLYTMTQSGVTVNITLTYPLTCCKMDNFKPVDTTCITTPTIVNSNFQNGCLSGFYDVYDQYSPYILGTIGGLLGFQVILIILASLLLVHIFSQGKGNKVAAHY